MVDPKKVTNYNRTNAELQEFLLFCICVAGKRSAIEAVKLDNFLNDKSPYEKATYKDHFHWVASLYVEGLLEERLKKHKISPYKQRFNSFSDVVGQLPWVLRYATRRDLEKIRGIGPKTSRFFLSHSREDFDEPVLDTHILKYLDGLGYDVPKTTPQNPKTYEKVAGYFREVAGTLGKSVTDLDLLVWKMFNMD